MLLKYAARIVCLLADMTDPRYGKVEVRVLASWPSWQKSTSCLRFARAGRLCLRGGRGATASGRPARPYGTARPRFQRRSLETRRRSGECQRRSENSNRPLDRLGGVQRVPLKNSPGSTASAPASFTMVAARGSRLPVSSCVITVRCSSALAARSSWLCSPRRRRRLFPKHSATVTPRIILGMMR